MKRNLALGVLTVLLAAMLCACANEGNDESVAGHEIFGFIAETMVDGKQGMFHGLPESSISDDNRLPIPQSLEAIPEAYFSPATQQGTLVELFYETYESKTYEQKT